MAPISKTNLRTQSQLFLLLQARLRLANSVAKDDILEAVRLMEMSKDSLRAESYQKARNQKPVDQIFAVVRELLAALPKDQEPEVSIDDAWAKAESKGKNCLGIVNIVYNFFLGITVPGPDMDTEC